MIHFYLIGRIIRLRCVLVAAPETIPGKSDLEIRLRTTNGFGLCVPLSKSSGMLEKTGTKPLIKSLILSLADNSQSNQEKIASCLSELKNSDTIFTLNPIHMINV